MAAQLLAIEHPLRVAIYLQEVDKVKQLIQSVNMKSTCDQMGETLLHIAVRHKASQQILEILISEFKKQNVTLDVSAGKFGLTPFEVACVHKHTVAVKAFLTAGANYKRMMNKESGKTFLEFYLENASPAEKKEIQAFFEVMQKNMGTAAILSTFNNVLAAEAKNNPGKTHSDSVKQPEEPVSYKPGENKKNV